MKDRINALLRRVSPNEKVQVAALGGMMLLLLVLLVTVIAIWPVMIAVLFLAVVVVIVSFMLYFVAKTLKQDWLDS